VQQLRKCPQLLQTSEDGLAKHCNSAVEIEFVPGGQEQPWLAVTAKIKSASSIEMNFIVAMLAPTPRFRVTGRDVSS
jgi:hypothetical protein